MNYFLKIVLLSLLLCLFSCATHNGYVSDSINISHHNFKIIGTASGTDFTQKILGIGGLNKHSLIFNAKKNMSFNYPLKKGQAYGNIILDIKKSRFLIYSKTQVFIHADIIDFDTTRFSDSETDEQNQPTIIEPITNKIHSLSINEIVLTKYKRKWIKMSVIKLTHECIHLKFLNLKKESVIVSKKPSDIYKLTKDFDTELETLHFNIGDNVYYKEFVNDDNLNKVRMGKIIAYQSNYYLIDFPKGIEPVKATMVYTQ